MKLLIFTCLALLGLGCFNRENTKSQSNETKRILLIDNLPIYNIKNDDYSHKLALDSTNKIAIYIDGGCFSCAEDFVLWKDFIKENKELLNNIQLLFYFSTHDLDTYKPYFKRWRFPKDIIIDSANTFFVKNNISLAKNHQAFLIDKNGNILLEGNPMYSDKKKEEYLLKLNSIKFLP